MSSHGMHVVHDGSPEAPPLLLIHASGGSGGSWGPMVPALAARHHVIRVDLPGCGQSPPPASYAVPAQARQVAALLDELGLRRVVVAGHSSGGWVATALAEQRPELVAGIALISSGASIDSLRPQPAILKLIRFPPVGRLLWSLQTDTMIRKTLLKMTARPVEIPPEAIAEMRGTSYHAFRMVLRHNTEYLIERSAPDRLAALEEHVPVLVIFGGAEPRYEPSSFRRYEKVPNVRVAMLPGVGHVPILEAPEATGALLLDFAAATAGAA